jgi:hypothetical protein
MQRSEAINKRHDAGDAVQVLQLVISGIAQGCIYGLIALGFVLIYKATETVSFRPGRADDAGRLPGGLVGMTMLGFPFWLAVVSAIGAWRRSAWCWSAPSFAPSWGSLRFPS